MKSGKIISLYTGAGGLDYGFEAAGFETAVAVEIDAICCETLHASRAWPVVDRDIYDVSSDEILCKAGVGKGEADVLIGGPPCQPFSKSGYWANGDAKRLDDPRSSTLQAYMRVLEDTQPKAFLLENVPGLAFNGKDEGLALLFDMLRSINRRAGTKYKAVVQQLCAADYGVPQVRHRVFVIGSRAGVELHFPKPTHAPREDFERHIAAPDVEPYRTAWDAIGDIAPGNSEAVAMTGKWAGLLPSIPEGANYLYHTDRGGGLPLFGWRRRYWTFLLKLAKNRPSWTLQAQPGPSTGPFHWDNRRLGKRELCRIQTFPDDVNIVGDLRAAQKQLGNAVPSLLAEVLAREIGAQLLGMKRVDKPPRLLPPDRSPPPPPSMPRPVPEQYRHLAGEHEPHPGTGQGYRAQAIHPSV